MFEMLACANGLQLEMEFRGTRLVSFILKLPFDFLVREVIFLQLRLRSRRRVVNENGNECSHSSDRSLALADNRHVNCECKSLKSEQIINFNYNIFLFLPSCRR